MSGYKVLDAKSEAQNLNNLVFSDYYYRLSLLARSVFKWNNLPNHIDEKWIEKYLFFHGKCMFFKDPKIGLAVAPCTDHGIINNYDEPTELTPVSSNGFIEAVPYKNGKDAILIRNNDDMIATRHTILLYALRLQNIQRTIDVNISAQKTPVTVVTNDKQKHTAKQIYKQVGDNHIVIFPDKEIDLSSIKVLKTDAPIVFPQLQLQKHQVWNEVMTFLGVNNANQDKRERLVAKEVTANNAQIELSADVMLKSRQKAVELINERFGENISVELRNAAELNLTPDNEELGSEPDVK